MTVELPSVCSDDVNVPNLGFIQSAVSSPDSSVAVIWTQRKLGSKDAITASDCS